MAAEEEAFDEVEAINGYFDQTFMISIMIHTSQRSS
jgi:hypothetical protein